MKRPGRSAKPEIAHKFNKLSRFFTIREPLSDHPNRQEGRNTGTEGACSGSSTCCRKKDLSDFSDNLRLKKTTARTSRHAIFAACPFRGARLPSKPVEHEETCNCPAGGGNGDSLPGGLPSIRHPHRRGVRNQREEHRPHRGLDRREERHPLRRDLRHAALVRRDPGGGQRPERPRRHRLRAPHGRHGRLRNEGGVRAPARYPQPPARSLRRPAGQPRLSGHRRGDLPHDLRRLQHRLHGRECPDSLSEHQCPGVRPPGGGAQLRIHRDGADRIPARGVENHRRHAREALHGTVRTPRHSASPAASGRDTPRHGPKSAWRTGCGAGCSVGRSAASGTAGSGSIRAIQPTGSGRMCASLPNAAAGRCRAA